jgi:molybdopterin adenylyltransferase
MGVDEHRADAPERVKVAILTVSDTRTPETDGAGRAARALIEATGHAVVDYRLVRDEPEQVAAQVRAWAVAGGPDAIVTSGGTGMSARDRSYEAVSALLDKEMPGFGELFRALSFVEIGAAAMLSRATAGLIGTTAVFCCPGSEAAIRLALERLILPELGHVVREARR